MENISETTQAASISENNSTKNKKQKSISVKAAVIIAIVVIIGALVYQYKGIFIAAMVNGAPISRYAVIHELEKEMGKKMLDTLITEKLINDEAQKKGITVTNEEVAAEIKTIEDQIKAQGGTLDQALAAQGITRDSFNEQITIQKKVEKILADKTQVTDAEVDKYISDNQITIPSGQEASYKEQIKNEIKQQKLSTEVQTLINSLKSQAKIQYFVNY